MKVLVVSTNGIIRDGITAWMIGCFSAMDRTGIEIHAVAHEGADETIAKEAEGAGIKVHVLPHRGKHAARYLVSLCLLLSRGGFDAIHV